MVGVLCIFEGGREGRERKKGDRNFIHFTRTRGTSEITGWPSTPRSRGTSELTG